MVLKMNFKDKDNLAINVKVLVFLSCLLLTNNIYGNSGTVPFKTELGFNTLLNETTPSFLNDVSSSVFEVRIPSEEQPSDIKIYDLNGESFNRLMNKMAELSLIDLDEHERVLVNKQVERCRRDKIESSCPIFTGFERATAFLAGGDGSYLLTNAHVVNRFLKLKAALDNISILELIKSPQWVPIFLFDKNGKLVFDPYLNPPALIKFGQPSAAALMLGNGWYGDDSDYVVIKLPEILGQPIPISKSKPIDENVFRIGFPGCTGCNRNSNLTEPELNKDRGLEKNSDGKQIYWTSGELYDLSHASQILKAPEGYFEYTHKENWLFFNSDAQVGMSGGPILNGLGEVIGVFAGSKQIINSDGSLGVLSRGVRPPEFK